MKTGLQEVTKVFLRAKDRQVAVVVVDLDSAKSLLPSSTSRFLGGPNPVSLLGAPISLKKTTPGSDPWQIQ